MSLPVIVEAQDSSAGNEGATLFSCETGAATFNAAARRYEVPVRFRLNIVSKRFNGSDFIVVAHVAVAGYTLRGESIPITVTSKKRGREGRSDLQELLRRHAEAHALRYAHAWRPHDALIWDNASVQHRARGDFALGEPRRLWRFLIAGPAPI